MCAAPSSTPPGLPPAVEEVETTLRTSDGLALEALVFAPSVGGRRGCLVMCHPHPLHAGTMHNKVVSTVVRIAAARSFATVRFNFRGVGRSEGEHDDGDGERRDLLAALDYAWRLTDADGLCVLGGYSFGAAVSARVVSDGARVDRLLLVAPPLGVRRVEPPPAPSGGLLLVVGDDDPYCSVAEAESFVSSYAEPRARLHVVAAAGHFFHGQLQPLAAAVSELLG